MAAHDGVDAAHARGHFQVDVHAVMRQHDDDLGALRARLVDHLLHVLFLDAEAPVRRHVARVGDRRVREGLADDRHRHAVHLLDDVRRKHLVAEIGGLDVLRDEIDLALEVLADDFLHPLVAQGHFPVRRHDVDAELQAGVDHVLAFGPQRGAGALPGVAAVEQQSAGPASAHPFDQRCKVGKAADLAVGLRGLFEIERREGVRLRRVRLQADLLEQLFADQVRDAPGRRADAEVHARLAEIHRLQLRMAVGEMQEVDIAEARQVIQVAGRRRSRQRRLRVDQHAARGGNAQQLRKLAPIHSHRSSLNAVYAGAARRPRCGNAPARRCYLFTGEAGSSSSAITSLICASVSTPLWPKRGMFEQAV